MAWRGLSTAQFNWMTVWLDHVLSWHVSIQRRISRNQISAWWHIRMYLAPIESATVLSTSETAIRDHKSVPIPNHRKLIGSDSDNRVPDRNLDAFPKNPNCSKFLFHMTHWADIISNDTHKFSTSLKNSFAWAWADKQGEHCPLSVV